jgi:hypothetical protein
MQERAPRRIAYPARYDPPMTATFQLTCVAYVRSTGGRVRLLLAIDRDGRPLFDGEPALLVEHRPGAPASRLLVEGPEGMDDAALELVHMSTGDAMARLIDDAHDEQGTLCGERLLGSAVSMQARAGSFDLDP